MASFGPWFSDTASISIQTEGATSIPVGKLQNLEVRIEAEETEYFSGDTDLREAVAHNQKVPIVSFEIGAWDVELMKQWIGGDDDSQSDAQLSTNSTTVAQKYDITAGLTPHDDSGAQEWQTEIIGVTFAEMPLFAAELGEFVGNSYEGRGDDLNITQDPAVA